MQRRRGRLGQDAALIGDAVRGDQHVLVDEETVAPAAAVEENDQRRGIGPHIRSVEI